MSWKQEKRKRRVEDYIYLATSITSLAAATIGIAKIYYEARKIEEEIKELRKKNDITSE